VTDGLGYGGLREKVNNAIDAAVRKMNKSRATSISQSDPIANGQPNIAVEITQTTLDDAWIAAGCKATAPNQLNEMELEIARFVSSALVQLFATFILQGIISSTPPLILALQENELPHAQQRPYILPTHIRIFQFLRTALSSIPEMRKYVSVDANGKGWIRNILSRDAGNSFGIWEQTEGCGSEEREMFGWGIWTDASFFNHSMAFFLLLFNF
jgi:SET and MYND domain-containing protein